MGPGSVAKGRTSAPGGRGGELREECTSKGSEGIGPTDRASR